LGRGVVSIAFQDKKKIVSLLDYQRISMIGEKYAAAGLRPTGFDYLRIILAVLIVLWHAILVCHEQSWAKIVVETQWRVPLLFLVPSFFSLSGFLIAGSLERSTIPVFIGLRILRIVPALAVDTLLTVLIVGPLFTVLPLREFFLNKITWKYLLNIAGHIHYRLPGVFRLNPIPEIINAQLSTIPWEFVCYSTIVVLAIVGIARSRRYFLAVGVIVPIFVTAILTILYPSRFAQNSQLIAPTNVDLVLCFLAGVGIYQYREMIPHSAAIAFLAAAGYVVLMNTQCGHVFTGILIAYITVWAGVTNYRKIFIIKGGDYSYGIYLYHFTLQQAIVSLGILAWYSVFIASLLLATVIAALSWGLVETPALSLRTYLTRRPNRHKAQSTVALPIRDDSLSPQSFR
jgi:peptidoglycan/LPS O-acetylase OafA/YrhL